MLLIGYCSLPALPAPRSPPYNIPMTTPRVVSILFSASLFAAPSLAAQPDFHVPKFDIAESPIALHGDVRPNQFLGVEGERAAWYLMEAYKAQAIGSLIVLKNASLKGLLRRVMGKIFNDFEIMGCCNDPQARRPKHHE